MVESVTNCKNKIIKTISFAQTTKYILFYVFI